MYYDWSSRGCTRGISTSENTVICKCKLLTHFALSMDAENPVEFETASKVANCVSIVGLVLTLVCYLGMK